MPDVAEQFVARNGDAAMLDEVAQEFEFARWSPLSA
jgi:hypothetical protein